MGDQVSKQDSFLNLLKTSFCGKLEMLSEKLDNVWLISSRHASQFFSITKVTAQDALSLSDWALINYAECVCGEELTWLVIWVASQNTNSWQTFTHNISWKQVFTKCMGMVSESHQVAKLSFTIHMLCGVKWNESIAPTRLLINCGIIPNISIIESEWIPFEMLLILWENLTLALRIWG